MPGRHPGPALGRGGCFSYGRRRAHAGLAAAMRTRAQAVKDALAPWHAGYDYDNFEETPSPASAVLPSASYRRLEKIKAAYDPAR